MTTPTIPTAADLNAHLQAGGRVVVSTPLRATEYRPKHAGMFFAGRDGSLRVKSGRGSLFLASSSLLLVSITKAGARGCDDWAAYARTTPAAERIPTFQCGCGGGCGTAGA